MLKHWIGYIILLYVAFLPLAKMDLYAASHTRPSTMLVDREECGRERHEGHEDDRGDRD